MLLLLTASTAFSDTRKFSANFFNPAIGKNTYLMLEDVSTLQKFQFQGGSYFSYAYHPLELFDATGKNRLQGVVDHLLTADVVAAIGITKWLQLGADMPLVIGNWYQSPDVVPGPGTKRYFDLGDLKVGAKARILDPCKYFVGLGISGFLQVPTGNSNHYVGDDGIGGGGKLLLEARVSKKIKLDLNAGYKTGKKVLLNNIEYQHRFIAGLGGAAEVAKDLNVFAEINAEAPFRRFFSQKAINPVEYLGGVRWKIPGSGFEISAGAGSCAVCGIKTARVRGVVGMNYRFESQKQKAEESSDYSSCIAKPVAETPVELPQSGRAVLIGNEISTYMPIRFAFNSTELTDHSKEMIADVVNFINSEKSIKKVRIEGNADSIGPLFVNKEISLKRADVVALYMVLLGVRDDVVLLPVGYGYFRPEVPNTSDENRAKNRRVVFIVVER